MRKDFSLLLDDILAEIALIEELCTDNSLDDIREDRALAHALKYAILTIGEAAKRLPLETRNAHPNIPWRHMAATRDFLAHGYDVINLEALWNTIHEDILPLKPALETARAHEKKRIG